MTNKNDQMDIIGFGALNMDQLHLVDKIAGPDEESFIHGFQESCGGSAANTVIGASRLGLKTGFVGKLASDGEGDLLHQNLIQEGVDVNGLIISPKGRSGRVMGFVDKKGDRALYVEPGINDEITIDQIDIDYASKTKIIHLSSFVGNSFNAQEDLLSQIPDEVKVSFDPGRIYAEKGFNALKKILNRTDILLINQAELKIMLASETDSNIKSNLNNFDSLSNLDKESNDKYNLIRAFDIFTDLGIDTIVVKMGDKGSFALDGSQEVFVPCFDVKCIDTTGAGDSFNAGFLYAQINDFSLEKSCEFGNLVASKCVECTGATNGLPSISNIDLEKYEKN
ncbi:MAG: carbohydrate kinase family protein [Methanobacteriales archaeon HGW-Methanobacteriales-1]|jgi:ribokinase|nr:MAG: carbohydrate kinase family protein [Methanobacteriales archaeon HGW-Methanobacteriales-1]